MMKTSEKGLETTRSQAEREILDELAAARPWPPRGDGDRRVEIIPEDEFAPLRLDDEERPLPARVQALADEAALIGVGLTGLARAVLALHGCGLRDMTDKQIESTRRELRRAFARSRGAR